MKKIHLILAIIFVLTKIPEAGAGWFGPDNYKECMEYYSDKSGNLPAHNAISWGCKNKFVTGHPKYGQCLLDHVAEIRGSAGFFLVDSGCAQLFREELIRDYPELSSEISKKSAKCMLRYVEKVIDDDSGLFFSNVKCGANISIRTTTTGKGRTITRTKSLRD